MKVSDILREKNIKVITTNPDETIHRAMEILITNKISCLPVLDTDNNLIGIISDKDIFKAVFEDQHGFASATVDALMSRDLIVGLPDDDISYISGVMTQNRIRHIPVVEKDKLIGLVSLGDIVKTQMDKIKIENRYLKDYVHSKYPG